MNTNNHIFNREDSTAEATAVQQEWQALAHVLHLPSAELLGGTPQALVAGNIVRHIQTVRRGLPFGLLDQLRREHNIERENLAGTPMARQGLHHAEAWLKVIRNHFSEAEFRALIERIPTAIRMTDGSEQWKAQSVMINNQNVDISIDLSHPIWARGSKEEIASRLQNKTPAESGIHTVLSQATHPLTATEVEEIFNTTANVIDSAIAQRPITINGIPNARTYTFDVPAILRDHPSVAAMNFTDLLDHLATVPDVLLYVTAREANGDLVNGAAIQSDINNTGNHRTDIADALARALNKAATDVFWQQNRTLSDAINRRSRMDRLIASTADNRELMLALTAVAQDPTALDVLDEGRSNTNAIRNELHKNAVRQEATSALQEMLSIGSIDCTETECKERVRILGILKANAEQAYSAPNTAGIDIYMGTVTLQGNTQNHGTALNFSDQAIASAMGCTRNTYRLFEPQQTLQNGAVVAGRNNDAQIEAILSSFEQKMQAQTETLKHIGKVLSSINALGRLLSQEGIPATSITSAAYPQMHACLNITTTPFSANPTAVGPALDLSALKKEVERALLQGNPSNPFLLEDAAAYDEKKKALFEQLTNATQTSSSLEGSDACWAIIRRGLEHQGIRGEELENTLSYMRTNMQETPEALADLQSLSEMAFSYEGNEDADAERQYNEAHSYRNIGLPSIRTDGILPSLSASKFNAFEAYQNALFTRRNIGISSDLTAADRALPLSRLIDSYFRIKYLMKLPESNDKHLPESTAMVRLMRNLHSVILHRAQKNMRYASGLKHNEMHAVFSQVLGIPANDVRSMTMTERVQSVHDFLLDGAEYMSSKSQEIERIAERAITPVRRRVQRHKAISGAIRGNAPWYTIVPIPAKIVRGVVGLGVNGTKGAVSLTKKGVANSARGAWNNKGSIALGAIAGSFIIPVPGVGAMLGAAGGPILKKLFSTATT